MNVKYYIFSLVLIFVFLLIPNRVCALSSDYEIQSYDVNIVVNEDNSLNIRETLGVFFNVPKHGIYRKIPLENEIIRLDGTTETNRTKITDIKVSSKYKAYKEGRNTVIKIGDANKTLTGFKLYQIDYVYHLGKDLSDSYDELYFNIIGSEWDTTISNITFNITMPKEFDKSKLGFSSGYYGSFDSSKITYVVDKNVISGKYNGVINPGEYLTIRLELPEGYFIYKKTKMSILYYFMYIIPVLSLLVSIVLWKKYGNDDEVISTVEFYPPAGLNSLEVSYVYNGTANNKSVISLLIYLANKGYIKIIEKKSKGIFYSDSFDIVKLKEYDGNNIYEKTFFDGLFGDAKISSRLKLKFTEDNKPILEEVNEDSSNEIEVVNSADLYNSFYIVVDLIKNKVCKDNKEYIYDFSNKKKSWSVIFAIIVSFFSVLFIPSWLYNQCMDIGTILGFGAFYLFIVLIILSTGKLDPVKLIACVFILIHSFATISTTSIGGAVSEDIRYLIGIIFGILCTIASIVVFHFMEKRTKYGIQMLGKIKGFKEFLETAKKEELESMVSRYPSYFYDILPYTYALGVSDKWINKFEIMALRKPDWYDGEFQSFDSFMDKSMNSLSKTMTSSPSSSSSGGSSGGGSSGGGSGGGGGGSW